LRREVLEILNEIGFAKERERKTITTRVSIVRLVLNGLLTKRLLNILEYG
jgi:hypothetical protein